MVGSPSATSPSPWGGSSHTLLKKPLTSGERQGLGKGISSVPTVEVLITTEYIRECIVNPEKTRLIKEALAAGVSQYSMQTFDQSLYDLYLQGLIRLEEALINSTNLNEFKLRMAGIRTATDDARDEMERASQVERFAKG